MKGGKSELSAGGQRMDVLNIRYYYHLLLKAVIIMIVNAVQIRDLL